ncbi:replication factor A protein 2 [Puccinia graminis f. sp. tritici]|uniref:Replication factor A protein 2 n=1 Tax=Puccinia graminis f. sp. tritici TaxID=56615 RepID=A0A5B0PKT9_PUCGR|nr:replication factor A protein 2 [Puccinia graminis f. sp. tritici]
MGTITEVVEEEGSCRRASDDQLKIRASQRSTCINRLTSVPPRGSISNPTEFLGIGTQNSNTPGGTGRVDQALRPVTIKQVLDAEASNSDSAISIQDIDVTNVSFCGVVRDIVRNATNVLLQVGDGTGGIEARKWIDSSDGESEGFEAETGIQFRETDRSSSIPINWVRVIGSPKLFNNKKTVAGLRVEKITDFNEINYRLLDAVRVTLAYERGATGAGDEMNIDQSTNHTTHGKDYPS